MQGSACGASPSPPRLVRVGDQDLPDRIDSLDNAVVPATLTKGRQEVALDDFICTCVGEDRLQPITDRDPYFALARRHDQQDAIVTIGLADSPMVAERPRE